MALNLALKALNLHTLVVKRHMFLSGPILILVWGISGSNETLVDAVTFLNSSV